MIRKWSMILIQNSASDPACHPGRKMRITRTTWSSPAVHNSQGVDPPALACFLNITTTPIDRYRTIVQNIRPRLVPPIPLLAASSIGWVIHCTAEYSISLHPAIENDVSRSILRRGQPEGTVQQRQRCSDLGVRLPNVARRQVPRRQTKGDSDYQDAYLQNQLPRSSRRVYAGRLGREQWQHSNCHGSSQQIENKVENEGRNQGELCRYCCMNLIRARLTVTIKFMLWYMVYTGRMVTKFRINGYR